MFLGRKIDKTEIDLKRRPFLPLEKNFSLDIFDCGCMAPLSKIVGMPLHGLTVHASTAFKQLVIAKVHRGVLAGFHF